jgi:hypothetical protein
MFFSISGMYKGKTKEQSSFPTSDSNRNKEKSHMGQCSRQIEKKKHVPKFSIEYKVTGQFHNGSHKAERIKYLFTRILHTL